MCQLLFSMTNSIKVVRKELNGVTKIINEIALYNELLIFLVVFFKFFFSYFSFSYFFLFYLGFILRVMHYFFPLVITELIY